jgi:hypothetical protein
MIFKTSLFEVKPKNDNSWEKMPEKDFLSSLHEAYSQISPALEKMFGGEEITTASIAYRIKYSS